MIKRSLPPIAHPEATILILGTSPGEKSLELQQYYAHPRNRFWKLLENTFNSDIPSNYAEKVKWLKNHKIALWDVAHCAIRQGSLDANMKQVEPNDLIDFLAKHPSIQMVAFNGQKAEKLFDKYFIRTSSYSFVSLPSSSPANTRFTQVQLQADWLKLKQ
jgi:hypoxanthine-DNA glycosylase